MLQAIHQNREAPRASSIYCQWIRDHRNPGAPLVAVWIDSDMRCFERELVSNSGAEHLQHDVLEEPGGTFLTKQSILEAAHDRS
jgi:hypothetical protein